MIQYSEKNRIYFLDNLRTFIIFLVVYLAMSRINLPVRNIDLKMAVPAVFLIGFVYSFVMTWLGFHLSLLGMMYIVINTFRYYLSRGGKIVTWFNKCSFGVYVVHFIAMGVAGTALLHSAMPSLAKYGLLTLITFATSNLVVYVYHLSVHGVWQLKTERA